MRLKETTPGKVLVVLKMMSGFVLYSKALGKAALLQATAEAP